MDNNVKAVTCRHLEQRQQKNRTKTNEILSLSTFHYIFVVAITTLSVVESHTQSSSHLLLVISYDGFAPHYLDDFNITLPNIQSFRQQGTYATHLKNVFPTKTFPNHHSIATGLFPGEHGVLGNDIFDSDMGTLNYSRQLYEYDLNVVPIWTLNELQGGKSGCLQWPGSEFPYSTRQINCSFTNTFNVSYPSPWEERVDTAMTWFNEGANLVMLYIEEPDKTGHMVGVRSTREQQVLLQLDSLTKYIERQIIDNSLHDRLNVIILSDHGMINTTPTKFINLTQWLPSHNVKIYGNSPVLQLYPETIEVEDLYKILLNASSLEKTFKVYRNKDLPDRWKYRNERRTGPVTVVAEESFAFDDMWQTAQWYATNFNIPLTNDSQYGIHGYDNELSSMHSLFLAKGPLIKQHHKVAPFNTVDLFHLFCEILELEPPSISGDRNNIIDILVEPTSIGLPVPLIILISVLVVIVLLSSAISVVIVRRRSRESQIVPPYIYDEPADMGVGLAEEHQKLLDITPSKVQTSDLDI